MPEHTREDDTVVPAVQGVRLHDLCHTFATLQLSSGIHFMQVSKFLGHSIFTLTLDTHGDWIFETEGGVANSLPEPAVPVVPAQAWMGELSEMPTERPGRREQLHHPRPHMPLPQAQKRIYPYQ